MKISKPKIIKTGQLFSVRLDPENGVGLANCLSEQPLRSRIHHLNALCPASAFSATFPSTPARTKFMPPSSSLFSSSAFSTFFHTFILLATQIIPLYRECNLRRPRRTWTVHNRLSLNMIIRTALYYCYQ